MLSRNELAFAGRYHYIIGNKAYIRLRSVPRHGATTTFEHSIRVGYMSEKLAGFFHADKQSASRVGLLHDFCLENYHKPGTSQWAYCFRHPEKAVENSEHEGFTLTEAEKDAIRSHMFPLSTHIPKSRIAVIVSLADKLVAVKEYAMNLSPHAAYQNSKAAA